MDDTTGSAFILGTLVASAALFAYRAARESISRRRLRSATPAGRPSRTAWPLAGAGVAAAVIVVWLEVPGPIPGDYNLAFLDAFYLVGIALLALALALNGLRGGAQARRGVSGATTPP